MTPNSQKSDDVPIIGPFQGSDRIYSNFFIEPDGTFVERDFQASKAYTEEDRQWILQAADPADARSRGRSPAIVVRPDWDLVKTDIMHELVLQKFKDHPSLRKRLLDTGDALLIELNHWHDNFWGSCTCPKCGNKGRNTLGILLCVVREELKQESL